MSQSSDRFESKASTQKGRIGERIVDGLFGQYNIVPYAATTDGPHPFDRLCASSDKRRLFVVEVKSKARRNFYPDTGVDERHYHDYKHIKETYQVPVYLFFVDELQRKIYGGELDFLSAPRRIEYKGRTLEYPITKGGIVYFPLKAMRTIGVLNDEDAERLVGASSRNYEYPLLDDDVGIELPALDTEAIAR